MKQKVAIILINYKDYAKKYLAECFDSLVKQDYEGGMKIFIVDNETSEESYNYLKEAINPPNPLQSPQPPLSRGRPQGGVKYEIIRNEKNDGFAKGNNDAMKLALEQGFEYVALFNMDTVVEMDCIRRMVEEIEKSPQPPLNKGGDSVIGAVQARLMLWPEKDKINSLGNVTHFLGFGYSDGYNERLDDNKDKKSPPPPFTKGGRYGARPKIKGGNNEICYPSGAAVLFKAEVLKKVGLFDEEFWMYNEDQDLGWRIWLAGYSCVLAQEAVVYHKYEFSRSIKKYYWMDRNRILAMLKNYHWLTLILITPACLAMELGLFVFAFQSGWLKEKIKVYKYFLSFKNWRYIFRARRKTQRLRKIKDKDIIKLFSGRIWYQEIDGVKLRIANLFFNIYWYIVRKIIIW